MRKTLPIYLDLQLAEAQLEVATKRKTQLMDRILPRLRHVIRLCAPLTGFPTFDFSVDLQRTKFKNSNTRISIMRWFPEGVGWEHVRYIDIPTIWLEESITDAAITTHLKDWLTERQARRDRRNAENLERYNQQRIEDLIKKAAELDPTLAEELKKWKLTKK